MAETKSTAKKQAATPAPATAAPHNANASNGLAIASLVTGIVAFISGWVFFLGFLLGAAAIVLGIIALKKPGGKGMSIAGIITGGLGALWSVVVTIFFVLGLLALGTSGVAVGGLVDETNKALANYNAENKALIEAKKDFAKGDTAKFGQFEVKVNSVKRDYSAEDSFYSASEGNELIVVNVTVKNTGDDEKFIGVYDLKINNAGTTDTSAFIDVDPAFESKDLAPGESMTGNLVYEVTKGSTDLKLQYDISIYELNGSGVKTLVYTLKI